MTIILRNISTVNEFKQMAELENRVWGLSPIPLHHTITATKNGGIAIGAYLEDKLVGFSYGFAGYREGESYLCSHMMGIDRDYRDHGIGYTLKLRQAEDAQKLGYKKIRWTFDPLESRNAYLNLTKLGAICSDYIENCYGEMDDQLNKGLPSDRFNVEWFIASQYVKTKEVLLPAVNFAGNNLLLDWQLNAAGLPEPNVCEPVVTDAYRLVPVPADFPIIRNNDPELALTWRMHTREAFLRSFAQGWAAVKVLRYQDMPVVYYLLMQRKELNLD